MSTSKGTSEGKKPARPSKAKSAPPIATKGNSKSAAKTATPSAQPAKSTKAPAATSAPKRKSAPSRNVITSEERTRMINEAAYYIAEKRGFQGGDPQQDWLEAAAQIDRVIMESNSSKD